MPPSAVPLPAGLRRRRPSRLELAELSLGLLLGIAGGWLAGLVRVRRP